MIVASPHPFHIYVEVHVLQLERILKVARAGMRRKTYKKGDFDTKFQSSTG